MKKKVVAMLLVGCSVMTEPMQCLAANVVDNTQYVEGLAEYKQKTTSEYNGKAILKSGTDWIYSDKSIDSNKVASCNEKTIFIYDKDESDSNWTYVESGEAAGYVPTSNLIFDDGIEQYKNRFATCVKLVVKSLDLRAEDSAASAVLRSVSDADVMALVSETDKSYQVSIDGVTGFISKRYATVTMDFEQANCVLPLADDNTGDLLAEFNNLRNNESGSNGASTNQIGNYYVDGLYSADSTLNIFQNLAPANIGNASNSASVTGGGAISISSTNDLVNYALQFVGNRYVWGGTSLTNGCDCSGFVLRVYEHFGAPLPRTSRAQSKVGVEVSTDSLQEGDLLFYGHNGTISHVAIYAGNGYIVHASNSKPYPQGGIKVSKYNYREIYKAVRIAR